MNTSPNELEEIVERKSQLKPKLLRITKSYC